MLAGGPGRPLELPRALGASFTTRLALSNGARCPSTARPSSALACPHVRGGNPRTARAPRRRPFSALAAVRSGAVVDGLAMRRGHAPLRRHSWSGRRWFSSPAPAPPYAGTDRRGKRAHTPEASRRARESRDGLNVRAAAAQPCGDASAAETGACVHVHGPLAHALAHAGTDRRGRVRWSVADTAPTHHRLLDAVA